MPMPGGASPKDPSMHSLLTAPFVRLFRHPGILLFCGACLLPGSWLRGVEPKPCAFDVPSGEAERTLKTFSEQCGRSLIVATNVTVGVRTNAVRGEFMPGDALQQMLAGTGLVATEDETSGAFSVRRQKDPPRDPGAPSSPATATVREPVPPAGRKMLPAGISRHRCDAVNTNIARRVYFDTLPAGRAWAQRAT